MFCVIFTYKNTKINHHYLQVTHIPVSQKPKKFTRIYNENIDNESL